jgi:hypothetical protein
MKFLNLKNAFLIYNKKLEEYKIYQQVTDQKQVTAVEVTQMEMVITIRPSYVQIIAV